MSKKKLNLNELTDEQLDTLIKEESVIIEQNQEKYIIIIPRNVTKDKNISVDDLIITEYSDKKIAAKNMAG